MGQVHRVVPAKSLEGVAYGVVDEQRRVAGIDLFQRHAKGRRPGFLLAGFMIGKCLVHVG